MPEPRRRPPTLPVARAAFAAWIAATVALGCAVPSPSGVGASPGAGPGKGGAKSPSPSPSPGADEPAPKASAAPASPAPLPSVRPPDAPTSVLAVPDTFFGKVLDLKGQPIAGVEVRGFLLSNNGAGMISGGSGNLVSNNGGSMVSGGGGNVISTGGGSLVSGGAGNYRAGGRYALAQAALVTRTDEQGRFKLVSADGTPLNIEAVASADIKAFSPGVASDTRGLVMNLAYTGEIQGVVTASDPIVSNFLGVDVFIPGTSYVAKCDAQGRFTLAGVPAGTFDVVAAKAGLGTAIASKVVVESKKAATAAGLVLDVARPTITAITPNTTGLGTTVTITGTNFGATRGAPVQVSFGGALASTPERTDDQTMQVVVPAGAQTGDVVVSVDGLPSLPQPFIPIAKLDFSATRFMHVGMSFPLHTYFLEAAGRRVDSAAVPHQWTASDPAIVDVEADGQLTARALGTGRIRLACGALVGESEITVTDKVYVETAVGSGQPGAVDGLSTQSSMDQPWGIAREKHGVYHVADVGNQRLRIVGWESRGSIAQLATLAGSGASGSADGADLAKVQFKSPSAVAFQAPDTLWVLEAEGHRLRRLDPSGVATVVGTGLPGAANGPGATATFDTPMGLTLGPDGNLYVADRKNHAIRKVDLTQPGFAVTTFAGGSAGGWLDGERTAAQFKTPDGLAFAPDGALIVADTGNNRIRRIGPDGTVTTLAGSGLAGLKDGVGAGAEFALPTGVAVGPDGTVYVADTNNHAIRTVAPDGTVATLAGTGVRGHLDELAATSRFSYPVGIVYEPDERALVVTANGNSTVRLIYLK